MTDISISNGRCLIGSDLVEASLLVANG